MVERSGAMMSQPMTPDQQERLAVVENDVNHLTADVAEIKTDVKAIRGTLAEARGGWKMLMLMGGAGAAAGGALVKFAPALFK